MKVFSLFGESQVQKLILTSLLAIKQEKLKKINVELKSNEEKMKILKVEDYAYKSLIMKQIILNTEKV